ncbi:uncharacterized protein K452DRAFT_306702 [Aplosporella prunicola CBS 121167]|uniref:Autophagy-related protein 33 n=1 Tax=Aplosporella prunicola CBS 121167 TaxID=1176127 RepID=A0A6A6BIV9_9PEZI|nr:uncharacterized protein K452DRAFT_306702 [Aplosporella prunicola CBS 121167]KAF2144070.1 hypothetical protein K452DRAFT_306702 [Aplosporella prunicola CBS 121167]
MAPTIAVCKFVGTISLGLLTGVSYTLSATALPSLLGLPTAANAYTAFLSLQTSAKRNLRLLTATTITSLSLAFVLSPSRARHPYLLWASLVAAAGGAVDYALRHDEDALIEEATNGGGEKSWVDVEKGEDVNGEMVRSAMEKFTRAESVRAAISGLAFTMGVVGIWGDGA